jgi:hypothetical protein
MCREVREAWIRAKYARKAFVNQQLVPRNGDEDTTDGETSITKPQYSKWRVAHRQKKRVSQRPAACVVDGELVTQPTAGAHYSLVICVY